MGRLERWQRDYLAWTAEPPAARSWVGPLIASLPAVALVGARFISEGEVRSTDLAIFGVMFVLLVITGYRAALRAADDRDRE